MEKIKIVCDGSYSKRLNYASVGCSFEYHNIKYNFSKMVNFERYKEKFDKLAIIFSKRSYTKDAHFLCRREADLKFIKVEYLANNTFRAMNIKKGTTYLVDIEKPTCTCRYFYYENKSQSCNLKLCKHIVAVKDFIRRAIKDEYVIELSK